MVDASPTFPEVLQKLEAWLDKHDLREGEGLKQAMWVTDGVSYIYHSQHNESSRTDLSSHGT